MVLAIPGWQRAWWNSSVISFLYWAVAGRLAIMILDKCFGIQRIIRPFSDSQWTCLRFSLIGWGSFGKAFLLERDFPVFTQSSIVELSFNIHINVPVKNLQMASRCMTKVPEWPFRVSQSKKQAFEASFHESQNLLSVLFGPQAFHMASNSITNTLKEVR